MSICIGERLLQCPLQDDSSMASVKLLCCKGCVKFLCCKHFIINFEVTANTMEPHQNWLSAGNSQHSLSHHFASLSLFVFAWMTKWWFIICFTNMLTCLKRQPDLNLWIFWILIWSPHAQINHAVHKPKWDDHYRPKGDSVVFLLLQEWFIENNITNSMFRCWFQGLVNVQCQHFHLRLAFLVNNNGSIWHDDWTSKCGVANWQICWGMLFLLGFDNESHFWINHFHLKLQWRDDWLDWLHWKMCSSPNEVFLRGSSKRNHPHACEDCS